MYLKCCQLKPFLVGLRFIMFSYQISYDSKLFLLCDALTKCSFPAKLELCSIPLLIIIHLVLISNVPACETIMLLSLVLLHLMTNKVLVKIRIWQQWCTVRKAHPRILASSDNVRRDVW